MRATNTRSFFSLMVDELERFFSSHETYFDLTPRSQANRQRGSVWLGEWRISMGQPNILYIFTDQQRVDTLRCYGNEQIETPALDELASAGFVFENAYVSQPVCSPARATMLTGLWPHTAGVPACNVPLRAEVPTFAEMLPAEYQTAFMGKWHLGDEIFPQHGFATWVGSEDSYRRGYSAPERLDVLSPYHHFLVEQGVCARRGEPRPARVLAPRRGIHAGGIHQGGVFGRAGRRVHPPERRRALCAVRQLSGAASAAHRAAQRVLRPGDPADRAEL